MIFKMSRRAFSQAERRSCAIPSSSSNIAPSTIRKSIAKRNKNTTNSNIAILLEFLESTSYNEPVSMKTLQSPSAKVVFSIFEHTLRISYPLFSLPAGKGEAEECFLGILRTFGYKTTISKSVLSTPGAFHAWPHILSALEWLRNELADADAILESGEIFLSDMDNLESETPMAKIGMDMLLACKNDVIGGSNPSQDVIETFQKRIFENLGVSQEQIDELERELEHLQNEPTAESLTARQQELQVAIREAEKATTVATVELSNVSGKMSGAEATAKRAAASVNELRRERDSLLASIKQLESKIVFQQANYGSLVQSHQVHSERYQQRLKVEKDLRDDLEKKTLELGRLDGLVPQALDKYNKLVMSVRKNPDCPNLAFRNYVADFDPVTQIPVICDDLKRARKQLETLEANAKREEAELSADLAASKIALERKLQAVEALKKRLAETQSLTAAMEEERTKRVSESVKWLSETELAISEMNLNIETRKTRKWALMEDYQQYQDGYKYYLDLNTKTREMKKNVVKETTDFLECFKFMYDAKLKDREARERAYAEFRMELLEGYAALDRQSADITAQANALKAQADALCRDIDI